MTRGYGLTGETEGGKGGVYVSPYPLLLPSLRLRLHSGRNEVRDGVGKGAGMLGHLSLSSRIIPAPFLAFFLVPTLRYAKGTEGMRDPKAERGEPT